LYPCKGKFTTVSHAVALGKLEDVSYTPQRVFRGIDARPDVFENFFLYPLLASTMASSPIPTEVSASGPVLTNGTSTKGQDVSSPHEEYQYLDLIQEILEHGEFRPDR